MTFPSHSFILPVGVRLDKFLFDALHESGDGLSRSRIQTLIEEGRVSGISPDKCKASFKTKMEIPIAVQLPPKKDVSLKPLDLKIPILYEDKYLAVVHKPVGMTVHPGAGTKDDTLVHALLTNIDILAPHSERPGIVHRLDRETEGVMLVAKTERAREALSRAFQERAIHKTYETLVWGRVALPETISGFIWRDIHNRKKMRFGETIPERIGRARTAELVITQAAEFKTATHLTIELITGRTHQIRATCAYFNAPIVGDALYGNDEAKYKLYKIGKEKRAVLAQGGMLLIARSLAFAHPFTKKKLRFVIDLPQRFVQALQYGIA